MIVLTARISIRDPDRFDITRKSGGVAGLPFAPSWTILRPALDARAEAHRLRPMHSPEADQIERLAWERYVPAYTEEMRESYRRTRFAWSALLARDRAVLVCYCTDAAHCHRALLAGILGKLGADVRGELPR